MSPDTATSLRLERTFAADPQTVFRAWTERDRVLNWSCPEGATLADVTIDLRVGGTYELRMRGPEGESYTAFGTYREVASPNRLVYTWDWREPEHAVGETLVTVEFHPVEGGRTRLVLTHERFLDPEQTAGHEEGWTSSLDRLEKLLA